VSGLPSLSQVYKCILLGTRLHAHYTLG